MIAGAQAAGPSDTDGSTRPPTPSGTVQPWPVDVHVSPVENQR